MFDSGVTGSQIQEYYDHRYAEDSQSKIIEGANMGEYSLEKLDKILHANCQKESHDN